MSIWNPWHGCHKISSGCQNCYVYRRDGQFEKDSSLVCKTQNFDLPIKRKKNGEYKLKAGEIVNTCFTSDFFVEEADKWRSETFEMIKLRSDLKFFIITKRIDRFISCIPSDWGNGYDNVLIACTVENQEMADYRLPIYINAPFIILRIFFIVFSLNLAGLLSFTEVLFLELKNSWSIGKLSSHIL